MQSHTKLKRILISLFRRREKLGQQLDKAYVRQSVADLLAIENRHRRVALMIDRLLPKLSPNDRQDLMRAL